MNKQTMDDGTVVLAVVKDKAGKPGLLAKYIVNDTPGKDTVKAAEMFVLKWNTEYPFVSSALVLRTKKSNEAQKALNLRFVFTSIEIIGADNNKMQEPSIAEIRNLVHKLSVQFSGKTFTEKDFDNIVHQQVLNSPDDNRNQDEVYDDACNAILFFFIYGFVEQVFENTPHGTVVLVYND